MKRFYLMLAVSLAINLFLLPVLAGKWFWSSRMGHWFVEELHPAEVKTVSLHTPPPPKPKRIPPPPKLKPKIAPARRRPSRAAAKPQTHPRPSAPRPGLLTSAGGMSRPGTPAVTQGTGRAGVPALPNPPPAEAPPPPPPLPKGPTRDAAPTSSPVPSIPDSLRSDVLSTFVRVQFDIAADGSARVTLLTSSGSAELDDRTLQTLRQWRWKPALRNGNAVPSVQRLRIEFEVN